MVSDTLHVISCHLSLLLLLFSHQAMSNSLRLHRLQHARFPCPSLSPKVCSISCPLSWWCHPAISSSAIPFSSWPRSFPASGPFPMSRLTASVGQGIGDSASASVLPVNIRGWLPLGWTAFSWFMTVYPEINLAFSLQSWQHWCSDGLRASYKVTPWTARLGLQTTWSQKLWVDFAMKGPHFRMEKPSLLN